MSVTNPEKLNEWGFHVLKEIERLSALAEKGATKEDCIELATSIKEVRECVHACKREVAVLKVKAGVWGLLGGMITVGVTLAVAFLSGLIKGGGG